MVEIQAPDAFFEGYLDRADDTSVSGWAWRRDTPHDPIEIEIIVDEVVVARSAADLYRSDLAALGGGRHGFRVPLPSELKGDRFHQLRVVYAGTNIDLLGSPRGISIDLALNSQAEKYAEGRARNAYRSPFGGLWTDLPNALEVIAGKAALGWISNTEAELLRHWIEKGFVILPQAVPHDLIDQLDEDVESLWAGTSPVRAYVESWENNIPTPKPAGPEFRDKRVKLLDLYVHLEAARQIMFAPPIVRFLALVFERPAVAFQSLYFRWGSQQDVHQDTAFVRVSSPLEFAASWVALEDIQPASGELQYYVGSHELEDYLFEGKLKWMPLTSPDYYYAFINSLRERSEARGLELQRFLPKKGDVLIWSADLAHGGNKHTMDGLTRKSLVTHYCPANCEPVYGDPGVKYPRHRFNDALSYSAVRRE